MSFTPSPQQLLFLWSVAVERPGTFIKEMAYNIEAKDRKKLEEAKFITVRKGLRGALIADLLDLGKQALRQNMSADLPRSGFASIILQRLLKCLHQRSEAGHSAWEELSGACPGLAGLADEGRATMKAPAPVAIAHASSSPAEVTKSALSSNNDVRSRLYEACQQLVGDGVYETRIRLADLRRSLPDVPRAEVDRALRELEQKHEGTLMRLDDPREIHAEDEAAALANSSGSPRHVLLLSRS